MNTIAKPLQPDLRDALIDAGIQILHHKGLAALTLRACAAKAGVSHAAPAYHFDGMPGLLGAIATSGFREITRYMEAALINTSVDPRDRLIAVCDGYLRFADEHSAMFTLMFNAGKNIQKSEEFGQASEAAYQMLHRACMPFEPPSGIPGTLETMIWSTVHGLATLKLGGRFRTIDNSCNAPEFEKLLPPLSLA